MSSFVFSVTLGMKNAKRNLLLFLIISSFSILYSQPVSVLKTYSKPVLMHYMPWFNTPEFDGAWGWHWTMNNQNPDIITNPDTGKRQIAAHFYPMIGPYASQDPNVIEFHLLLMKYAGVDGVLIDWYGVEGSNGDINSLLNNSNALIDQMDEVGLSFGLILEDRFSESISDAQANLAYAKDNYFSNPSFFRYDDAPLVGVFGPITFQTEDEWNQILPSAGEDLEFLQLWYEKNDVGANSDGEYVWIYEDENLDDFEARLNNFYSNRAPNLNTVMGVAYVGFEDFYMEGGAGNGFFTISHNNGQTLETTLDLISEYDEHIDLLQLATWNDFGEGTMFEPTWEFGFSFLTQLQDFLGVEYGEHEFEQILRLYNLRKEHKNDSNIQSQLDEVFTHFTMLEVEEGVAIMDEIEGVNSVFGSKNEWEVSIYPNPVSEILTIHGEITSDAFIEIFNSLGQKMEVSFEENSIDFSKFENGIYWISITSNRGLWTSSIIKN